MPSLPTLPSWSARNPLGILALFIALIYGMAALLLGVAVSRLTATNQSVLVWFLALFPVAVLSTFAWLVARHHKKLYGPGDFRSDESFLENRAPETFGERFQKSTNDAIADEIDQGDVELQTDADIDTHGEPEAVDVASNVADTATPKPKLFLNAIPVSGIEAFAAETLAFQELQQEFSGPVLRNVRFGSKEVDGIIETAAGPLAVEVSIIRATKLLSSIRRKIPRMREWATSMPGKTIWVIVDVIDGRQDQIWSALRSNTDITQISRGLSIRIYSLPELARKYGMTSMFQ